MKGNPVSGCLGGLKALCAAAAWKAAAFRSRIGEVVGGCLNAGAELMVGQLPVIVCLLIMPAFICAVVFVWLVIMACMASKLIKQEAINGKP